MTAAPCLPNGGDEDINETLDALLERLIAYYRDAAICPATHYCDVPATAIASAFSTLIHRLSTHAAGRLGAAMGNTPDAHANVAAILAAVAGHATYLVPGFGRLAVLRKVGEILAEAAARGDR